MHFFLVIVGFFKMNKKIFFLLLLLLPSLTEAKKIQAVISNARFFMKPDGSYLEFYLSVAGNSVNFRSNAAGKFQAALQISINLKDTSGASVFKDSYNLLSPEIADTNVINFNFLDQKRIACKNGFYLLETKILDKNSDNKELKVQQRIEMNFSHDKVGISDIVLIDKYTPTVNTNTLSKNGYDMIPFVDNFYPKSMNNLTF